jgi:hypothetical protein
VSITEIILTLLIIPASVFAGVMWERMQWETLADEDLFNVDHDTDLEG